MAQMVYKWYRMAQMVGKVIINNHLHRMAQMAQMAKSINNHLHRMAQMAQMPQMPHYNFAYSTVSDVNEV